MQAAVSCQGLEWDDGKLNFFWGGKDARLAGFRSIPSGLDCGSMLHMPPLSWTVPYSFENRIFATFMYMHEAAQL